MRHSDELGLLSSTLMNAHISASIVSGVFVRVLFGVDRDGDGSVMEEDHTSLINVSDGLWPWAAVGRLSVSRPSSQAAQ